ncbi:MAG: hypothetical protein EOM50_03350 [Erysipelotrichia bacterium]|nr:hypothetical protein [Erysipelotrichia bacterium]NCC53934.1 hypothetical protein [Erysipelotrichia bacterium]
MPKRRNRQPLNAEKKLELAQTIAKKSQSFKKTYASVENTFVKAFRSFSTWVDFVLFNQRFAKLVAVCLALILYLVINGPDKGNSIFVSSVKQVVTLENVKVTTNISSSVYEVTGLPESVSVDVIGDTSDVQFASQQKDSYQVIADLEVFGEGTHEVTLEPVNFSDKVEVKIQPNTALVTIKKKISRSFSIGYDYINTNKLDKIYSLEEPEFSQNEVIVKASEETLTKISYVKALINVNGVKADFEQDAKLVAYDQEGTPVSVDILPESVTAKVKVTTPHKEVPIEIIPEGKMKDGLAIESYTLDHSSITIYAPQDVLDTIDQVSISIPVTRISKDTKVTMPIMLPVGVSKGNITKVSVNLKVGEETSTTIDNVPIIYKHLDNNLKFKLADDTAATTSVVVKGAKSVLESINADNISVVLDLEGYNKAMSNEEVTLSVSGKNKLASYSLKNNTIRITLEEK